MGKKQKDFSQRSFSVFIQNDFENAQLDWGWKILNRWMRSVKEGAAWLDDGDMRQSDAQALLKHFELDGYVGVPDYSSLLTMSPAKLIELRRAREAAEHLPTVTVLSVTLGRHIPAELVV